MAWALRICTTIFRRRARGPVKRLTSPTNLGPSRVPASWTATAADRLLGMAPLSLRRRTTACNVHPPRAIDAGDGGGQTVAKAVVGVVVESCDGEPPPHDVYGSVTATATTMASGGEPPLSHRLFHKVKGDQVRLAEGTAAIPLLLTERVVVSAPLRSESELKVSASLRGVNNAYYYGDHEIADGSVVFAPSLAGTDTAVIPGNHGKVRVDVTWSST
ncbi:hypothetical protein ACQ4PT_013321 [Festuca glaucescens]